MPVYKPLKQKYWLTEYMSISRVIAKSKKTYEKSFRYTEADNNDIGYFVAYNLRVLDLSFKQLQGYLKRKQEEKKAANTTRAKANPTAVLKAYTTPVSRLGSSPCVA